MGSIPLAFRFNCRRQMRCHGRSPEQKALMPIPPRERDHLQRLNGCKKHRIPQKTVAHSFKDILYMPRVTISLDAIGSMRVMYGGDICPHLSVSLIPHWTHESDLKGSNIDGWPRLRGETGESERAGNGKAMVLQFELLNKVVKWMRSPSVRLSAFR